MPQRPLGLVIVGLGLAVVVIGLVVWAGGLSWFGRLPGDLRIEHDNVRAYVPIVSMLLLSVVLSAIVWVIRRLF